MKNDIDFYINDLTKFIADKKKDLQQCEKELINWDCSYLIKESLGKLKLNLKKDIEKYELELFLVLENTKVI